MRFFVNLSYQHSLLHSSSRSIYLQCKRCVLFLKKLFFFERLPLSKSHQINKRIILLILLGMLFVLTLTLWSFTFVEFEYDDLPSIEGSAITGIKVFFAPESFLSGFRLAVFAAILLVEYLRSHIGEKRFSDGAAALGHPFSTVSFLTTAPVEPSFVFIAAKRH